MAKREEFKLTLEFCQRLLEVCMLGRSSFPKKWGEKPVPEEEQLLGADDLGSLFKVLRAHSPWLQGIGDEYKVIFGMKDDWYPIDKSEKRLDVRDYSDERIASWKMHNPFKAVTLRLDPMALSGAVWCCILRLHPHGVIATSTKEAVDTWWPITEALGKSLAVKKYIGLAAAKRVPWEDDPEPATP